MGVTRFCGFVLVAACALLAAGCGGSAANEHHALVGWAIAGHPLDGATIEAVDASGKVIATSPSRTLKTGVWYLPLEDPPHDFTLLARGGTDDGKPFHGALKAAVHDYDHGDPHALHLNPATTLVTAYLDQHHDALVADGERTVARFLRIPDPLDLGSSLRATDKFFSGPEFVHDAQANGGFGPFVNKLEHELEAGKTHAFPRPPANRAEGDPISSSTVQAVASTVTPLQFLQGLSAATSVVDNIVSLIRGGQQADAITSIESQLSSLESQFAELHATIDAIAQEQKKQDYNNAVEPLAQLLERLQVTYPLYQVMIQSNGGSADQISAAITNFEDSIDMPNGDDWTDTWRGGDKGIGVDGIYAHMVTQGGGSEGALEAWSALSGTSSVRFIDPNTQQQAATALAFWTNVQSEVMAVNAAYENAMNTGSATGGGTTTTSNPISMNYTQDVAEFGGDNVADAAANCVASGGSTTNTNFLLNEYNASHTCFQQIWNNTSYWVDQATGLMWEYNGDATPDTYADLSQNQATNTQWGFPPISDPAWRMPAIGDLKTLGNAAYPGWDVSAEYSTPLSLLADYGQIDIFQSIEDAVQCCGPGSDPLVPGQDYAPTFWSSTNGDCTVLSESRDGRYTQCYQQSWDVRTGATPWGCADWDPNGDCVGLSDGDAGTTYDPPPPMWGSTHANDGSDWLWVRAVPEGEGPYGGS